MIILERGKRPDVVVPLRDRCLVRPRCHHPDIWGCMFGLEPNSKDRQARDKHTTTFSGRRGTRICKKAISDY